MGVTMKHSTGTVIVTCGSMCGMMGYHFDFADHVEYVSLLDQRKAFEKILELMDSGKDVQLYNCTLTSLYREIQACQQNIIDEATNLLAKLEQN